MKTPPATRMTHLWALAITFAVLGARLTAAVESSPAEAKPAKEAGAKAGKPRETPPVSEDGWQSLFDGKSLKGWKASDFAGKGEVTLEKGAIVIGLGNDMTGITCTNEPRRSNYEISLDAKRVDGSDFFCGFTFPVKQDYCSLILGGWGGGVVGLSSIDGNDASSNQTSSFRTFKQDQWYQVRVKVTDEKIEAWLDSEKIVDFKIEDHKIGTRIEVEESKPLGIATWRTTGAVRDLKWRKLR